MRTTSNYDLDAIAETSSDEPIGSEIVDMLSEFTPHVAYACAKTGLLLLDDQLEHYSPEAVAKWEAAIDEYFRLEPEGRSTEQIEG